MCIETEELSIAYALRIKPSLPVRFNTGRIISGNCMDDLCLIGEIESDLAMTAGGRIEYN
jgi:hypothetical protein